MPYRTRSWHWRKFVDPLGGCSCQDTYDLQFYPLFSQELHRAGFCCSGHRRSVQGMRTTVEYRLPRSKSGGGSPNNSSPDESGDRSGLPKRAPSLNEPLQEPTLSGNIKNRGSTKSPPRSQLLRTEETMLRYSLSRQQIKAAAAAAGNMFEPQFIEMTDSAEDIKKWEQSIRLFSEHIRLRPVVLCQRYQKRDNVTKAEISSNHPEVEKEIREGYFKLMQRLKAFRKHTALPFPPNCGVFLKW